MTAHVLTAQVDNIGKAGKKPMYSRGPRALIAQVYQFDFGTDNSSGADGEDISVIWNDFNTILYIGVEVRDTSTESEHREGHIDWTNKKLVIYSDTDATPAAQSATNIGFLTVDLFVVGF